MKSITTDEPQARSPDLVAENIATLPTPFPEAGETGAQLVFTFHGGHRNCRAV